MGKLQFNIDEASDDEYFAVTEGMALIGAAMEEKPTSTLLVLRLGADGNDAILAGAVSGHTIEKLDALLVKLKERAQLEASDSDGALTLHLETMAD